MARPNLKRLTHDEYGVAIICPLEVEMSAVRYMLDEEHARLPNKEGDSNDYIYGRMSGHNVVIGYLPQGSQGVGAAAVVATNMIRTFPQASLRLLVGIGGVPSKVNDVWLGDVVVSMPTGVHGGVVQYDLGKDNITGFERKGLLEPPPTSWRTRVVRVQSDHLVQDNQIAAFLTAMVGKYPRLTRYGRPAGTEDVLFLPSNEHVSGELTCQRCDHTAVVDRPARSSNAPVIFYGLIASGNRVVKNPALRDQIAQDAGGALCFEMEAAGLINEFRCIVIRGISDYADSHKNDDWHGYAAAVAAGCAKELLAYMDVADQSARLGVKTPPPSSAPVNPQQATENMHEAIRNRDLTRVRALVASGIPVTVADTNGRTPLHTAAALDDVRSLKYLIRQGANMNAEAFDGQTALHVAVINDCLSAARALRALGANDTVRDDSGKRAEDYIPEDDVQKLWSLRYGEDISALDPATGNTVLMHAAIKGNVAACKALLCAGVSITAKNQQLKTALHFACIFDHLDTIALLLEHDADPNTADSENFSSFMRCIWAGHYEATRLMLRSGRVNVDAPGGPRRQTAMHEAAWARDWKAVFLLLEHSANVKTKDTNGNTLLHTAIMGGSSLETVERLLKAGAPPNTSNPCQYTPMDEAIVRRRWDMARLLLKHESNAAARSYDKNYPLFCYVAQQQCPDLSLLRLFVEKGADVNAANVDGWTALQEVCNSGGHPEIVRELLWLGADPNTRMGIEFHGLRPQSTALMHIATGLRASNEYGHEMVTIINLLLDAGAVVDAIEGRGWSALRYAVEFRKDRNACVLLTRGANPRMRAYDGPTPADQARKQPAFFPQLCALLDSLSV